MYSFQHSSGYDAEHLIVKPTMRRNDSGIVPSRDYVLTRDATPFYRWMAEALAPSFDSLGRVTLVRAVDPNANRCFNIYSIKVLTRRAVMLTDDDGILIGADGSVKGGILPFRATISLPFRMFSFSLNIFLPEYIDDWYDMANDVLRPFLTESLAQFAARADSNGFVLS